MTVMTSLYLHHKQNGWLHELILLQSLASGEEEGSSSTVIFAAVSSQSLELCLIPLGTFGLPAPFAPSIVLRPCAGHFATVAFAPLQDLLLPLPAGPRFGNLARFPRFL